MSSKAVGVDEGMTSGVKERVHRVTCEWQRRGPQWFGAEWMLG